MKKYIVVFKNSRQTLCSYQSREEASAKLMEFINGVNNHLNADYLSLFDFDLEEVECDVNEVITDFESAKKYLFGNTNDVFGVAKKRISESVVKIEKAEKLIKELNPKHIEALVALNRLFTIAEAWNKADGFVPDLSDRSQTKWFPWFRYDKDAAWFVFDTTRYAPTIAAASLGSRLFFKTRERAEQFGKQFSDLYNKVFL